MHFFGGKMFSLNPVSLKEITFCKTGRRILAAQCTLLRWKCTVYSVHFTVHSTQCTHQIAHIPHSTTVHSAQRTVYSSQCRRHPSESMLRDDPAFVFIEPSFHLPQNKDIFESQTSHLGRNVSKSEKWDSKNKSDMSQFLDTKHQCNLGSNR